MTNSNEDKLAFLDAPAADPAPNADPVVEPPKPEAPAADPANQPPVVPPALGEQQKGDAHTVPLPKYLDAYNEAKEYKKKLADYEAREREAQARAQAQAPDPMLDPKGYGDYVRNQTRAEMQGEIVQTRLNISETMARQLHGDGVVDEAKQAFEAKAAQQPWIAQRVMNSQHPWNEMVAWHKQDKLLGEIGDPSKLNDWIMSRAAALAPAAQPAGTPPAIPVPPAPVAPPVSLSRAPAAAKPSDSPVGPGHAFSAVFGS